MPLTKYESNSGAIYAMRLSTDSLAEAGAPPAGAVDRAVIAKVSKSTREYGIKPRGVNLQRLVGTAPDQAAKYKFLPVLTPTAFGGAGFQLGATITFGGFTWTIIARIEEDSN